MHITEQRLRARMAKQCFLNCDWAFEPQQSEKLRRMALATKTLALVAHDRILDARYRRPL